jgi:tetratricopeptide (TPR) repeat protein
MPHTMSDEWFRSPLWREKDRELFEAKLARAHKGNRAQYLRIKALSLAESGDKAARAAAGDLFERIFNEYPDDGLQVTMAHADKARGHRQGGEHDQAVEHYRRAVALEDAHGSIDSGVDLDLAELLVERNEDLEEAQDARPGGCQGLGIQGRAVAVAAYRRSPRCQGRPAAAQHGERTGSAQALDDDRPDFPRHPGVGLIDTDRRTVREVKRPAASR